MTTPEGQRTYDAAVKIVEALDPLALYPGHHDAIVIHGRHRDCVHSDGPSLDGRVFETGFFGPVHGRRTRTIVIDRDVFFREVSSGLHGRKAIDWVRQTLMCRLEPGGHFILV